MKNYIKLIILLLFIHISYCKAMDPDQLPPLIDDPEFNTALLEPTSAYLLSENEPYLTESHPPLIIMLSGCAGMGKTTVAKLLQMRLMALRINGDDTRVFLRDNGNYHGGLPVPIKVGRLLKCIDHFAAIIKKQANQTIILDDSIDRAEVRYYERVVEIAKRHSYSTCVIRLEVPREITLARIRTRESSAPSNLKHLEEHFAEYCKDYDEFDRSRIDYTLHNSSDETGELLVTTNPLIDALERRITE